MSKKIPEEKVPHKSLSIIILDSVIYACEKYHPQTFLEECKYAKENAKTNNYIDQELKSEFIFTEFIWVFILTLIMKNKSHSDNNKQIF